MSGGVRYASTALMPEAMRKAAELALRKESVPDIVEKGDKRRKYRNEPTTVDGFRFDSKREARRYEQLKILRDAGDIKWFTRQVPFWLPGNIKYIADFLIIYSDSSIVVEDVKSEGTRTRVYINKRKQIKALYGIDIIEL